MRFENKESKWFSLPFLISIGYVICYTVDHSAIHPVLNLGPVTQGQGRVTVV